VTDKQALKLVILYNARGHEYTVLDHNLTPEEAAEEVTNSRRDGLPAFTVDQRRRHLAAQAENCRACRYDVKRSFQPGIQTERRERM